MTEIKNLIDKTTPGRLEELMIAYNKLPKTSGGKKTRKSRKSRKSKR